ncbi:MAG: hypothetical protein OIF35_09315 [Cellvibrionaceae bacterium]|nr:hypothetical protein [Cellvibrionaceae bacterium]MCV6626263.1 hypothetical protein [Cellvibrionaceae bacterium]
MKKDILPQMEDIELNDRKQQPAPLRLAVFQAGDRLQLFLAEHNRHGEGAIAANSLVYIQQLIDRYQLDPAQCDFYRYVYSPASGALLGRFVVRHSGDKALSYSLKMLSQLELESLASLLLSESPQAFNQVQLQAAN